MQMHLLVTGHLSHCQHIQHCLPPYLQKMKYLHGNINAMMQLVTKHNDV